MARNVRRFKREAEQLARDMLDDPDRAEQMHDAFRERTGFQLALVQTERGEELMMVDDVSGAT